MSTFVPPSYFDAGWATTFAAWCAAIGADPLDVAPLLIGESEWNPGAENAQQCVGLNQICPVSYGVFSGSLSVAQYLALPVSQQLAYVFKFWRQEMAAHGLTSISGRDLYALNYVPAYYKPNQPDSAVLVPPGNENYNAALDIGGKGYITYGDLQTRLETMKAQNPALWGYLNTQLAGATVASAANVVGVAVTSFLVGFLGKLAWDWRARRA